MNTTSLNRASETENQENQTDSNNSKRVSGAGSYDASSKKVEKAKGAFLTISEVADKLDVQQHVLRFWETKFNQVKPLKRGGGRRYYRPEDVALLERIHHLLYTEGYTIKGVQKLLKGQGKAQIIAAAREEKQAANAPQQYQTKNLPSQQQSAPAQEAKAVDQASKTAIDDQQREVLQVMLDELKAMRAMLDA